MVKVFKARTSNYRQPNNSLQPTRASASHNFPNSALGRAAELNTLGIPGEHMTILKMWRLMALAIFAISFNGLCIAEDSAIEESDRGQYLGKYSDYIQSEESADCAGQNVRLWKKDGVMTGSYSTVSNQCYDDPEHFFKVEFDSSTARLKFTVTINDEFYGERVYFFSGKLTKKALVGNMERQYKKTEQTYYSEVILKKVVE